MPASTLTVMAPAKINLYLHVTGRRDDGYHTLDSLMIFADVADQVTLHPASRFSFAIEGPYAKAFTAQDRDETPASRNLAVRAAHESARFFDRKLDMRLTLTKNLPLSSGIGGGSADAAAVVWGLIRYWGLNAPPLSSLMPLLLSLGADVPVCYMCQGAHVTGIGDRLRPVDLPEYPSVLVNPRQSCPTPEIFARYKEHASGFASPVTLPALPDRRDLLSLLQRRGNDLEAPAMDKLPVIDDVMQALKETRHADLVRMSGSGATVFALYPDHDTAEDAATLIRQRYPGWWVRPCTLGRAVRY